MNQEHLGFTQVPNDVFEKILTSDFSKRQLKILLLIGRCQFGYRRAKANLRHSDFRLCGIRRTTIKTEINALVSMFVVGHDPISHLLWINRDLAAWTVPPIGTMTLGDVAKVRTMVLSKQFKRVPDVGNIIDEKRKDLAALFSAKKY